MWLTDKALVYHVQGAEFNFNYPTHPWEKKKKPTKVARHFGTHQ